ncbi:hypothetical protein E7X58_08905 [Streptomyces sp. A1499]|nr:hypothetical protein E7X58_08905 [Streptomyces sp. A1499]
MARRSSSAPVTPDRDVPGLIVEFGDHPLHRRGGSPGSAPRPPPTAGPGPSTRSAAEPIRTAICPRRPGTSWSGVCSGRSARGGCGSVMRAWS